MSNPWMPIWARPNKSSKKLLIGYSCVILLLLWRVYTLFEYPIGGNLGWEGTYTPDKRIDITGSTAAVACDIPECSQMGIKVLKSGGSAADAAVQVALCIGTLAPQSSGIGGGGFITVRFPNGTAFAIDARETAPSGASKHMFDGHPELSKYGGLASGVPGELAGLEKLWQIGGKLNWSDLVLPVAELNDNGFNRNEALIYTQSYIKKALYPDDFNKLMENSDWCWLFSDDHRCSHHFETKSKPNIIRRPKLANTLREIASKGARVFYHGAIPESLVQITQKLGGILTVEDFANYTAILRPALQGSYNGLNFVTAPAPASGPALVMGLKVMEELQKHSNSSLDQFVLAHRTIETMKWMAAARSELGDTEFINNPKIEEMVEMEWVRRVVSNISDLHTLHSWRDYHPSYEINNPKGTSHISIVDKDGMGVSMTTTVNLSFGNGICDPNTGIIMNSEMDDFSVPDRQNFFGLAPSVYNFVEPGKRPLSSAVPLVLFSNSGEVELVLGAAGGSRILTAVFLATVRLYGQLQLSALEAVSFPRYHHQLIPESLNLESGFSPEFISAMEAKGHKIEDSILKSTMNLVQRDSEGIWHAISDYYRKRGLGAAY